MDHTPLEHLWGIVLAAGEGARARAFLQQLCGGRGIKQFCAVIGRRSMLQHTLARVERLIPRERILVVVSTDHRTEVAQQLAQWPADNVIYQPANCGTGPGIFLPLAYVTHRDPAATVAVFPSDHFIVEEACFMATVERAVVEVQQFPHELVLLGMTPDRVEDGYGWIEPGAAAAGRESLTVRRFVEKPSLTCASQLLGHGALWNTLVFTVQISTLWELFHTCAPDLCDTFNTIRLMLNNSYAPRFIVRVYETLRVRNFSAEVCEPLAARLRVLPAPQVGWSDWGTEERILASLRQIEKLDECLARLRHREGIAESPSEKLRKDSRVFVTSGEWTRGGLTSRHGG